MRPVLPLELAGKTELEFDLYNENGAVILKKGDPITPGFLMQMEAYNLSFYMVETKSKLEDFEEEPKIFNKDFKNKSLFSEKLQESLVASSKKVMQSVIDGEGIDTKSCNEATAIVVNEVAEKLDTIKGIDELRVYDKYTFSHTINVSSMSTALGLILDLKEDQIHELSTGALLHDIGKMLIPKDILFKPGKLTPEEFEVVKEHTTKGYNYIKKRTDLSEEIARVALEHQERFGGTGYPGKRKNNEISYYAQIAAVVDVYDALISNRVYKKGMENAEALRIMIAEGSKSFNPFMLYRFVYIANYKEKSNLV